MKFNKRAEQETMRNIIIAVVAFVVLVLILFLIFRSQILDYVRNLPGYSTNQTDRVIDATSKLDNLKSSLGCGKNTVGTIKSISSERNFIVDWVSSSAYRVYIGTSSTELLIYNSGSLELDENINEKVGQVDDGGVIRIDSNWINDDILRGNHPTIPSAGKLRVIDGAYLTKDNKICRRD